MNSIQSARLTRITILIFLAICGSIHTGQLRAQSSELSPDIPNLDRQVEYVNTVGGVTDAVYTQDNYAYIGLGVRMVILDITDPDNPQHVGEIDVEGIVQGIVVVDTIAYIAAAQGGLRIVDISQLAAPKEIANSAPKGSTNEVTIVGDYAYLEKYDRSQPNTQ